MDTYHILRSELEKIQWVDAHSHVIHYAIVPPETSGPYEVLPLVRLLLSFDLRACFLNTNLTQAQLTDIWNGNIPPESQKQWVLSCISMQNKSAYIYFMRGLRDLYTIEDWEITADNFDIINQRISNSTYGIYDLLSRVYDLGGIQYSVLNLWADRGRCYLTDYRDKLSDIDRAKNDAFCVFLATLDFRAMYPFSELTAQYARQFGITLNTLADYENLLRQAAAWFVKEKNVRGFKISEMYYRRLDYKARSYEEAAACYHPDHTAEEARILSDYTAYVIFRIAGELGVPVQIHTGSLYGDFAIEDVNPAFLADVIKAFPQTKFDLLHGGDPYYGTSVLMAEAFPNVYLNLSSCPVSSYDTCRDWISRYLDRIPSSKISIGWDCFLPESVCGGAYYTRNLLAEVLSHKINAELYSAERAIEVAKDIMYRTAQSLYGRPLEERSTEC